jgi:hypothetical protein
MSEIDTYRLAKDFIDEIMGSNLMHMERVARLKVLLDKVAAQHRVQSDSACSHPFATYSDNVKTCVGCGAVLPQSR